MGKIFCLIGKSACGKDTLYKQLLADASLSLKLTAAVRGSGRAAAALRLRGLYTGVPECATSDLYQRQKLLFFTLQLLQKNR